MNANHALQKSPVQNGKWKRRKVEAEPVADELLNVDLAAQAAAETLMMKQTDCCRRKCGQG
jgi:hypothetical protein